MDALKLTQIVAEALNSAEANRDGALVSAEVKSYPGIGSLHLEVTVEPLDGATGRVLFTALTGSTVTMQEEDYDRLKRESRELNALENAGVDNWEGYGMALSELENDCE